MKRLSLVFLILLNFYLAVPPAHGEISFVPYEYDSTLAWKSQLDQLLDEVVERVTRFLKPVNGAISSHFGERLHPVLGRVRHHDGVDIACASGSEVRAVLPGQVILAGWSGGYGNLIKIRHKGEITESRYGHLSKLLVSSGQMVKTGELIGFSGKTGLATGPHLHFELFRKSLLIDPERFLSTSNRIRDK
ncbi:MAG: M23 family metallopeptidase [Deltaproteobacteria bacterium]|nr:MAG: M23 family metallopeptidase [Deltaproteobacteria bacterium]